MDETAMTKQAWRKARVQLDKVEARRAKLLEPTAPAYSDARTALRTVEKQTGRPVGICRTCGDPIFPGEQYRREHKETLCSAHTPSYAAFLTSPGSVRHPETGKPYTASQAIDIVRAHMADGGRVEDKMFT